MRVSVRTYAEFYFLSTLFAKSRALLENVYSMQTCHLAIGGCIRNRHGCLPNFSLSVNYNCNCSEHLISPAGEFALSARRQNLMHGRVRYSVTSRVLYGLLSFIVDCSLKVFEWKVMRKIYDPIKNQDGGWIIRTNKEIDLLEEDADIVSHI